VQSCALDSQPIWAACVLARLHPAALLGDLRLTIPEACGMLDMDVCNGWPHRGSRPYDLPRDRLVGRGQSTSMSRL
jgi:hypothetical protein